MKKCDLLFFKAAPASDALDHRVWVAKLLRVQILRTVKKKYSIMNMNSI